MRNLQINSVLKNNMDNYFVSNCCGAKTTEPDIDNLAICLECKEHCEAVDEDEYNADMQGEIYG